MTMRITRRVLTVAVSSLALAVMAGAAKAEKMYGPGASDTEIKIGNTNPYSGNASAYGAIGKSIAAYFKKVNDEGGVNGRKIDFITLDDGYNPPKTVEQVRRLVEQENVLFLFQPLGTPSNTAIEQYMNENKVPQVYVATGADKWNDPKNFPWTIGWQPSYRVEARIYAKYILDNVQDPKIAVLYQNDDFGKDYLIGLKEGLGDKADKLIVATKSYEVNEPTVDSQIVALKASGANVLVDATTPKFAALAIRKTYDIEWKALHILTNVSTSVSSVMQPAGAEKGVGVISSYYLKDPTDPQWQNTPEYADWLAWMKKYNPDVDIANTFAVYGYTVAQNMVEVLKQCGDNLTRENVMKQATSVKGLKLSMLLPGIEISTSPTDYAPIKQMQLQKFDGKTWQLFGPIISGVGS
jgi:ABC-type branched-subunit amino acid transport system substrate-binding protein